MLPASIRTGRSLVRACAVLAAALAFVAVPATAPAQTWVMGLTGGGSFGHQDLTPGTGHETIFKSGWLVGLQGERWLGSRFGIRLNVSFTQRELQRTGAYYDYNVVGADLDVLARPLPPNDLRLAPYVVLGAGATHYGSVAGSPPLGAVPNDPNPPFGEEPIYRVHILAGVGVDLALTRMIGVRVEAGDKIVLPSIGESPESSGLPNAHSAVVMAGVQYLMGGIRAPTRVARRPAPPEQPVAQPAPAPEPEAAEPEPEPEPEAVEPEPEVAEPAPAQQPAPEPADLEETLYTVQIDAYMVASTADRWVERLIQRGIPAWRVDSVLGGTPVSVVRAGALPTEADARQLARIIQEEFGRDTKLDRIKPDEPVPPSAVVESLRLLGGQ